MTQKQIALNPNERAMAVELLKGNEDESVKTLYNTILARSQPWLDEEEAVTLADLMPADDKLAVALAEKLRAFFAPPPEPVQEMPSDPPPPDPEPQP
jgi:hypothetical protein